MFVFLCHKLMAILGSVCVWEEGRGERNEERVPTKKQMYSLFLKNLLGCNSRCLHVWEKERVGEETLDLSA